MNASAYGAHCDGVHDDAAGIRAAIAAARAAGQSEVHLPACLNDYMLLTKDPSGLGAIVIGDGASPDAVNLVGDSYAVDLADTTYNKRVRLYLGNGMNVPVIYHRKNAAVSSVRNMLINGNAANQSGSGANACGNALYTVCSEDFIKPTRESGLSLFDVILEGGYNGSYYLGSGRGAVYLHNVWALGSGKSQSDAQIFLNGYDTILDNPQIANSTGFGVYVAEGTQYQIENGAMWSNRVAIAINANVNQISVVGTQIGANATNGIQTAGPSSANAQGTRTFTNVSFNSNSLSANGGYADFSVGSGGKATLVAPDFAGNSLGGAKPNYNIACNGPPGSCKIQVVAPNYVAGASATVSLTNDLQSMGNGLYGNVEIAGSARVNGAVEIKSPRQYAGLSIHNDANIVAQLVGTSATNDNPVLNLLSDGKVKISLPALGSSYFLGGAVGFGSSTPQYQVDVAGQIRATAGYVVGSAVGVSCHGAPTPAFTIVDGIVTHC